MHNQVNGVTFHRYVLFSRLVRDHAQRQHDVAQQFLAVVGQAQRLDLIRLEQRERSEEHTSELQSLMRISYAVFCMKKKKQLYNTMTYTPTLNTQQITNLLHTS